jgi:hypothetical protein
MATNTTGLLIIRAWIEEGSSKPLRAHLRLTTDVAAGITSEITLTEISAVAAAVEAWLHDVVLSARPPSGNGAGVTLS